MYIDYFQLLDEAKRKVAYKILHNIQQFGLKPLHSIILSLQTNYPGVILPKHIKTMYSEHIVLVLEHQFYNLQVNDNDFSVELSFSGILTTVVVPWESLLSIADPKANFLLQFDTLKPSKTSPRLYNLNNSNNLSKTSTVKLISSKDTTKVKNKQKEGTTTNNIVKFDKFNNLQKSPNSQLTKSDNDSDKSS